MTFICFKKHIPLKNRRGSKEIQELQLHIPMLR